MAHAGSGVDLARIGVREILVSETMRLSTSGTEVLGIWEPAEGRVVIRKDQLQSARVFCGTLLHELEHAACGHQDLTQGFEDALTSRLGVIAGAALSPGQT